MINPKKTTPGEYHVLHALRVAQEELATYRAEDTELHRALHAMSAEDVQEDSP